MIDTLNWDRQVSQLSKKIDLAIRDFENRDRKQILRKAAAPVRKSARSLAPKRRGTRPNPRYSNGRIVAVYHPGNLRRSMKTLSFRRSRDIFVGPRFSKKSAPQFGKPGQPTDGYYAAMVYGSAKAFSNRVLRPALAQNKSKVIGIVVRESRSRMVKRILSRQRI